MCKQFSKINFNFLIIDENLQTFLVHGRLMEGESLRAGDVPHLLPDGLQTDLGSEESRQEASTASPGQTSADNERLEDPEDVRYQLGLGARGQGPLDGPVS